MHTKSCAICGAYIEEHYVGFTPKDNTEKPGDKCQVEGCNHTAYEGHQYEADGCTYTICLTHRSRIKTWQQHPDKGLEQTPILHQNGLLIDNPHYKIKQSKKK